jgi:hypothetical protein
MPIHQSDAEFCLQLAHVLADRRLGAIQHDCGRAEVEVLSNDG